MDGVYNGVAGLQEAGFVQGAADPEGAFALGDESGQGGGFGREGVFGREDGFAEVLYYRQVFV